MPSLPFLVLVAPLVSQLQSRALGAPTFTIHQAFSEVVAVAELSDGRTLVADRRDRAFYAVARDGRSAAQLGRNGRGPDEYSGAFGIVRLPGDTLALYGGELTFLRVTPTGQLADPLPIPVSLLKGGGLTPPRGADARGAIYWAGDLVGTTPNGFRRNLLQTVRRWRPPDERVDTVALAADHARAVHGNRFFPFPERDAWVVAPDGRVGVLSAAEYRLRWYADGKLVSEGPVVPHARVRVTAADREGLRTMSRARPAAGVRALDASGRPEARGAPARPSREEAYPDEVFPTHKPPFVEAGLFRAPSGDLWVLRSMPHDAPRARIDILGEDGNRKAELDLPAGRRLVALERGGIWLVRVDDDGLQWLERYAWPSP